MGRYWNLSEKSGLCIFGSPYSTPGPEPEAYKSEYVLGVMISSFLSLARNLLILSSIWKQYLDILSEMGENLVESEIRPFMLWR